MADKAHMLGRDNLGHLSSALLLLLVCPSPYLNSALASLIKSTRPAWKGA